MVNGALRTIIFVILINLINILKTSSTSDSKKLLNDILKYNHCKNMTIGLLANPNPYHDLDYNQIKYDTNYINWLQLNNVRVVPISLFLNEIELDNVLLKVNGVLLPGGVVNIKENNKFMAFAGKLIEKIMKHNINNDKIALWGTCQGLEIIAYYFAKNKLKILNKLNGVHHKSMATDEHVQTSKNWKLGKYLANSNNLELFLHHTVNVHSHNYGVKLDELLKYNNKLNDIIEITSIQKDDDNELFVDSFQSYEPYNFHGVQFHPESLTDYEFHFSLFNKEEILWEKASKVSALISSFFIEQSRFSNYCYEKDLNPLKTFKEINYEVMPVCNESYFHFINSNENKDLEFICVPNIDY